MAEQLGLCWTLSETPNAGFLTSLCINLQTDVRELIQVDDAMEDESLRFGPNGGLVFCME